MEQNYDHLVGKEIHVTACGYDKSYRVDGVDPEVGITLSDVEDSTEQLCLVEPTVHAARQGITWDPAVLSTKLEHYKLSFDHWLSYIQSGTLDQEWSDIDDAIDAKFDYFPHGYPDDLCPFT